MSLSRDIYLRYLPLPRRSCDSRRSFFNLSHSKSCEKILMKLSGNVDNGPRNWLFTFGDVLDSGRTFTFDLIKILGQNQRPRGFNHKASSWLCHITLYFFCLHICSAWGHYVSELTEGSHPSSRSLNRRCGNPSCPVQQCGWIPRWPAWAPPPQDRSARVETKGQDTFDVANILNILKYSEKVEIKKL